MALNGVSLLSLATILLRLLAVYQEEVCTPDKCPLCGEDNHCGHLDSSDKSQSCWCFNRQLRFPDALLEELSASHLDNACICQACVLVGCKGESSESV